MPSVRCLCLLLAMSVTVSLAQDDGYETFPSMPGSRYKLYTFHQTWPQALTICQGDGGGSLLVVINSEEEAEVVREMFARIPDPTLIVGIDDVAQEGIWRTVHGGLVSTSGYNKWQVGQPDGDTAGNCGMVDKNALYADGSCSNFRFPFICEKPGV